MLNCLWLVQIWCTSWRGFKRLHCAKQHKSPIQIFIVHFVMNKLMGINFTVWLWKCGKASPYQSQCKQGLEGLVMLLSCWTHSSNLHEVSSSIQWVDLSCHFHFGCRYKLLTNKCCFKIILWLSEKNLVFNKNKWHKLLFLCFLHACNGAI